VENRPFWSVLRANALRELKWTERFVVPPTDEGKPEVMAFKIRDGWA
jgi:hypothetical protein